MRRISLTAKYSVVAIVLSRSAGVVLACSCAPPPPVDERFADADVVFFGQLVNEEPDYEPIFFPLFPSPNYRPPSRGLTFRVITSWKGIVGTEVGLVTEAGGASCGFFGSLGELYLVYAYEEPISGKLWVGLCSFCPEHFAVAEIAALDGIAPRLVLTNGDDPTFPPQPLGLCGIGSVGAFVSSMFGLLVVRRQSVRRCRLS